MDEAVENEEADQEKVDSVSQNSGGQEETDEGTEEEEKGSNRPRESLP